MQCFILTSRRGALASIANPLVSYVLKNSIFLCIFLYQVTILAPSLMIQKYFVLIRVKNSKLFGYQTMFQPPIRNVEKTEKNNSYPMLSVQNCSVQEFLTSCQTRMLEMFFYTQILYFRHSNESFENRQFF